MGRRICIFSALFLPSRGGVEFFTDNLARVLADQGNEVVVVANATHGGDAREDLPGGVRVVRLPCWSLLGGRLPVPKPNRLFRSLVKEIREDRFEGVLVNTRFYPHSLLGVWIARRQGGRAVVLDHGAAYLTLGNSIADKAIVLYERIITKALRAMDPVFCGVSPSSVSWLRNFGIEAFGVIPNAIDADAYLDAASSRSFRKELGLDDETPVVSFVGRLVPEKGVRELADAAEMVAAGRERPPAFLLAGEGPLKEELACHASENLFLLGGLTPQDVAALLRESSVFCFPSRSEGFGSALLEAAVSGNSLVSTDVGIASLLIRGEADGVMLESADAASVAQAVEDCLELRGCGGPACAERARRLFSWQESAKALFLAFEAAREPSLR